MKGHLKTNSACWQEMKKMLRSLSPKISEIQLQRPGSRQSGNPGARVLLRAVRPDNSVVWPMNGIKDHNSAH